ncbi:hypothetical protein Srubr_06180 [Streptomyces rubradiris]|uniref:Uncharacterized protein n=1 Tax=Streptomyces rubradiris TaxID=285531 RepID=A0ABQ3R4I6_STRRR|nr:hypothetical protein GCM10018792_25240 [Streptomyces rubradiris]GHI50772.1 hypothetical protein Srubr_06180 [Streptomyces rubradiris]
MARQGAQKALENCTSVARSPSAAPSSAAPMRLPSSRPPTRTLPFRRRRGSSRRARQRRTAGPVVISTTRPGAAKIPGGTPGDGKGGLKIRGGM